MRGPSLGSIHERIATQGRRDGANQLANATVEVIKKGETVLSANCKTPTLQGEIMTTDRLTNPRVMEQPAPGLQKTATGEQPEKQRSPPFEEPQGQGAAD